MHKGFIKINNIINTRTNLTYLFTNNLNLSIIHQEIKNIRQKIKNKVVIINHYITNKMIFTKIIIIIIRNKDDININLNNIL